MGNNSTKSESIIHESRGLPRSRDNCLLPHSRDGILQQQCLLCDVSRSPRPPGNALRFPVAGRLSRFVACRHVQNADREVQDLRPPLSPSRHTRHEKVLRAFPRPRRIFVSRRGGIDRPTSGDGPVAQETGLPACKQCCGPQGGMGGRPKNESGIGLRRAVLRVAAPRDALPAPPGARETGHAEHRTAEISSCPASGGDPGCLYDQPGRPKLPVNTRSRPSGRGL